MAGAVHQNDIENNPEIPEMQQIAIRCVLASELAYENEEQINAAVTNQWGMNFIEFFDCWNDYLQANTTQAFVFTDTARTKVFVVFRGTERGSWKDWLTDCRFANYEIRELGRVHTGFLEALGLGTREDIATLDLATENMLGRQNRTLNDNHRTSGLPNNNDPNAVQNEVPVTDPNPNAVQNGVPVTDPNAVQNAVLVTDPNPNAVQNEVPVTDPNLNAVQNEVPVTDPNPNAIQNGVPVMDLNPNAVQNGGRGRVVLRNEQRVLAYDAISDTVRPFVDAGASLYVTGHSLGGALATLFTAVRLLEKSGNDPTLGGVFTFGQPRVGDAAFARYVEATLSPPPHTQTHERKYFRFVFRSDIVPCLLCKFTHIRPCYFYRSVNQSEVLDNRPCCLRILPRISALNELRPSLVHGSRSVVPLWKKFLAVLMPEICDHSIVYYITAIQQAPNPFSA